MVVTAVDDASEAAAAPLTLPSIVTTVNDIAVVSKADAIAAVQQVSTPGASFTVTFVAPRAAKREDGDWTHLTATGETAAKASSKLCANVWNGKNMKNAVL